MFVSVWIVWEGVGEDSTSALNAGVFGPAQPNTSIHIKRAGKNCWNLLLCLDRFIMCYYTERQEITFSFILAKNSNHDQDYVERLKENSLQE